MNNTDKIEHVLGRSIFLDDIPEITGTLYGVVITAPVAHAHVISINLADAASTSGIHLILTSKDIPGENQIGSIIPDEPLFADSEIHYKGQPMGLIIGESILQCREAVAKISFEVEELPVITSALEAHEQGSYIAPPRTFMLGDIKSAFNDCDHIFEGIAETGGQEHLYLETQGAYAVPTEKGHLKVFSSTQAPTAVQKQIARVLAISMHAVEVDVNRLGGGFGGKEDQATPWAVMAALASYHTRKPTKIVLSRHDDLRMTGKRHPYHSRFRIGLDKDYKIKAFEVDYFQDAGASADLSPAITERTLFHSTNSYHIPNVKATVYSCKTNLPPNTAFRGFGAPQAMFVIESAIHLAAQHLEVPVYRLQEMNLMKSGDIFPYGQRLEQNSLHQAWEQAKTIRVIESCEHEVNQFNQNNNLKKRGWSVFPITFGISFTNTSLNQARALIHIYLDGSVMVSTGAVEMGQGVNKKMAQVASRILGIPTSKIFVNTTNTSRIANTSPTAASATADLNGKAVEQACLVLRERILKVAASMMGVDSTSLSISEGKIHSEKKDVNLDWEQLVSEAYLRRTNLSEHSHYSTPGIQFDKRIEKGNPFSYYVSGLALTQVEVDCLRGTHEVLSVKIIHDFGNSMDPATDLGQVEGALMQGIGWVTMEEVRYDKWGTLMSNALSTYKVPDIYSAPKNVEVIFMDNGADNPAILKSKAVGEPPFNYGIGVFFALQEAIKAFNPLYKTNYLSPLTPERILLSLYEGKH